VGSLYLGDLPRRFGHCQVSQRLCGLRRRRILLGLISCLGSLYGSLRMDVPDLFELERLN
jgi:hypothetical protein